MPDPLLMTVILAALLFGFGNGWNDATGTMTTAISTRVLSPYRALALTTVLNVVGAFLSVRVAETVGRGIVDPGGISLTAILAALLAAILWVAVMTVMRVPISASHALIGGLVGAVVAHGGWGLVNSGGIRLIISAMLIYPIVGGVAGYLLMQLIYQFLSGASPHDVSRIFRPAQVVSVSLLALGHGTADAQKVMGVMVLALLAAGKLTAFSVPAWVQVAGALSLGLGTALGGWNAIRTRSMRTFRLHPAGGFAAEAGAAVLLIAAGQLGVPVSTTHTITGSILGMGATSRISTVRWGIANLTLYAWILTMPGVALIAYLLHRLIAIML